VAAKRLGPIDHPSWVGVNRSHLTVPVGEEGVHRELVCTRLASDSRASTQGDDSSTRRPSGATILSITCRTASSPRIPTGYSRYPRLYGKVANRAVLKGPSGPLH
jgi:hypothetical protein